MAPVHKLLFYLANGASERGLWKGNFLLLFHFPMQNEPKILPKSSSGVICPVISPSASCAARGR
jgi:hypothetical protein